MRVISGTAKGLRLKSLPNNSTRPTADRVKESLFNILAPTILQMNVLDLFAGTGALGIESLSRGAKSCVFVDSSPEATKIITENLEHTSLMDKAKLLICDADRFLHNSTDKFDIIFMDPPYKKDILPEMLGIIAEKNILSPKGIIITESDIKDILPYEVGNIIKAREKKFGITVLSFYGWR